MKSFVLHGNRKSYTYLYGYCVYNQLRDIAIVANVNKCTETTSRALRHSVKKLLNRYGVLQYRLRARTRLVVIRTGFISTIPSRFRDEIKTPLRCVFVDVCRSISPPPSLPPPQPCCNHAIQVGRLGGQGLRRAGGGKLGVREESVQKNLPESLMDVVRTVNYAGCETGNAGRT